MINKIIIFRLITWIIGGLLAVISRFVFLNDNDLMWSISSLFNEVVCILSILPVAHLMLVADMIRSKGKILKHILTMLILLICFGIYVFVWVACTGGV